MSRSLSSSASEKGRFQVPAAAAVLPTTVLRFLRQRRRANSTGESLVAEVALSLLLVLIAAVGYLITNHTALGIVLAALSWAPVACCLREPSGNLRPDNAAARVSADSCCGENRTTRPSPTRRADNMISGVTASCKTAATFFARPAFVGRAQSDADWVLAEARSDTYSAEGRTVL